MSDVTKMLKEERTLKQQIAAQAQEIERLRAELDARKAGTDVIVLERHGNDLWRGIRATYDENGRVVKSPERPNSFTVRPKTQGPNAGATDKDALEATVAGAVPQLVPAGAAE